MGHNIVRLLVVCPGLKPNELFPFSIFDRLIMYDHKVSHDHLIIRSVRTTLWSYIRKDANCRRSKL